MFCNIFLTSPDFYSPEKGKFSFCYFYTFLIKNLARDLGLNFLLKFSEFFSSLNLQNLHLYYISLCLSVPVFSVTAEPFVLKFFLVFRNSAGKVLSYSWVLWLRYWTANSEFMRISAVRSVGFGS